MISVLLELDSVPWGRKARITVFEAKQESVSPSRTCVGGQAGPGVALHGPWSFYPGPLLCLVCVPKFTSWSKMTALAAASQEGREKGRKRARRLPLTLP